MTTMTHRITGNTYAHQDKIKRQGGQWDKASKSWLVTADAAAKLTNPTWIGRRVARELISTPISPIGASGDDYEYPVYDSAPDYESERDAANYVGRKKNSPTRANDNIAAGRPCYCDVYVRCDFCTGFAALCGSRADDFWAWHRDRTTGAE